MVSVTFDSNIELHPLQKCKKIYPSAVVFFPRVGFSNGKRLKGQINIILVDHVCLSQVIYGISMLLNPDYVDTVPGRDYLFPLFIG